LLNDEYHIKMEHICFHNVTNILELWQSFYEYIIFRSNLDI